MWDCVHTTATFLKDFAWRVVPLPCLTLRDVSFEWSAECDEYLQGGLSATDYLSFIYALTYDGVGVKELQWADTDISQVLDWIEKGGSKQEVSLGGCGNYGLNILVFWLRMGCSLVILTENCHQHSGATHDFKRKQICHGY